MLHPHGQWFAHRLATVIPTASPHQSYTERNLHKLHGGGAQSGERTSDAAAGGRSCTLSCRGGRHRVPATYPSDAPPQLLGAGCGDGRGGDHDGLVAVR
jgi:hypothetical protein